MVATDHLGVAGILSQQLLGVGADLLEGVGILLDNLGPVVLEPGDRVGMSAVGLGNLQVLVQLADIPVGVGNTGGLAAVENVGSLEQGVAVQSGVASGEAGTPSALRASQKRVTDRPSSSSGTYRPWAAYQPAMVEPVDSSTR